MTWEETILFARKQEDLKELIKQCYLTEDLKWNVESYRTCDEFKEILKMIKIYSPEGKSILEFGSGNGIAALSFALNGYDVTSSEPDESETVGAGAIKRLKAAYHLANVKVIKSYAEEIEESDDSYDIIFARQCMHHANDLEKFVQNAYRMLKPKGLFLTVRDHVINSDVNKQEFLKTHPLHKYYGGENAFTLNEYENAFRKAGFKIEKTIKYFDSLINYFPEENVSLKTLNDRRNNFILKKFPNLSKVDFFKKMLLKSFEMKNGKITDDSSIVGRMYSFIAIKE